MTPCVSDVRKNLPRHFPIFSTRHSGAGRNPANTKTPRNAGVSGSFNSSNACLTYNHFSYSEDGVL